MRVYLPATPADLPQDAVSGRGAFAVTAALMRELPGEDTEAWEFAAFLAAADSSVALLRAAGHPAPRRTVISADVPAGALSAPADPDAHPAAIDITAPVPWDAVAAIHIDEAEAEEDILLALGGDAEAIQRLEDRDLLWYAPEERPLLPPL